MGDHFEWHLLKMIVKWLRLGVICYRPLQLAGLILKQLLQQYIIVNKLVSAGWQTPIENVLLVLQVPQIILLTIHVGFMQVFYSHAPMKVWLWKSIISALEVS